MSGYEGGLGERPSGLDAPQILQCLRPRQAALRSTLFEVQPLLEEEGKMCICQ
jgi:hypothetical protein